MDRMDNQQQQQQSQPYPGPSANPSQNPGNAGAQGNTQSVAPQLQRRPSIQLQRSEVDIPQHSPAPAYANDRNQIKSQQSNQQQTNVELPQNTHQQQPNQQLHHQQQHQNHNQQYVAISNPQNMQQQQAVHAHHQILVPLQNSSQQSQPNSLNPSPVSQPAVINQPLSHQQHVLQPILNYQPPQQIQSQGMYKPVSMVQTPVLYANAVTAPPGQNAMNPATQPSPVAVNTELPAVAAPPGSPTEVVKRGRFRVTKGGKSSCNLSETISPSDVSGRKELTDNVSGSEHTSTGLETATAPSDTSLTKKKGRFVVKSGAGGNQTVKPNAVSGEEVSDKKVQNPDGVEKNNACDSKAGEIPAEVLAVIGEDSNTVPSVKQTTNDTAGSKPNDPSSAPSVPKKKGRFVVKKGATTARSSTPPPLHDALSLDGSTSKQSIPTVVSTITNGFQDQSAVPMNQNSNTAAPLYQMQQPQVFVQPVANSVAANLSVPFANVQNSQAVGAYDINGNFVFVSAPIIAPQNYPPQPINQHPPPSSANTATQPQPSISQQVPPTPDAPKPKKVTTNPKIPRQTEAAAHRHSIGGRIFGTTGVGKVLHHLESVRLEVIEADKSIASLQSENKILKDKNKELEAKNAKLERQLAEERAKNKKLSKSLGQNQPDPNLNSQVNKKEAVSSVIPTASHTNGNKPLMGDKNATQKRSSDSSVGSSPPKLPNPVQNRGEQTTPTKQSKHYVEDSMKSLDISEKGNGLLSKTADPNDACFHFISGQGDNKSLPSSPRPSMFQEASSVSTASDMASSLCELPSVETTPQQIAIVEGFDQQLPTVPVVATGAVVVPMLVSNETKRFDPLGTPKRSGSRILPNGNLQELSELNSVQQSSNFAVPQINVTGRTFTSTVPIQPNNVYAGSTLPQPPLSQQQQPGDNISQPPTHIPTTQHQPSQNMPMNQSQQPDPFDEIALRHGCSQ